VTRRTNGEEIETANIATKDPWQPRTRTALQASRHVRRQP
jgi:hypothetical protein